MNYNDVCSFDEIKISKKSQEYNEKSGRNNPNIKVEDRLLNYSHTKKSKISTSFQENIKNLNNKLYTNQNYLNSIGINQDFAQNFIDKTNVK